MANEITTKTTIFKVVLDKDDYAKGAADLGKDIDNLKAKQKELELTTGKNTVEYQRVTAQLKLTQAEQRKLTDLQKAAITVEKAQEGSNQKLRSQLTLLTDQYNKLSKEQRENTTAGKELGDSIAGITAELKLNEGAVGDTRRNVGNYTESIVAAGEKMKVTTVFTDENRKANLGLQNQMEAATKSAAAIGGAFAVLSRIIGDNEKAQAALEKITLAVAVATAVANVAKNKGAILDSIASAKTKALIVTQTIYNGVVKGGTLALNAFKIALAGLGIGAIIAGIGFLIQKLSGFSGETKTATDKTAELNNELDRQKEVLQEINDLYDDIAGVRIQFIQRQIDLRKAQGASEIELADLEISKIKEKEAALKEFIERNSGLIDQVEKVFEAQQELLNIQNDLRIVEIDKANKAAELNKKRIEEQQRINELLKEEGDAVVFAYTGINDIIKESKDLFTDIGMQYQTATESILAANEAQAASLEEQLAAADEANVEFFENELDRQRRRREELQKTADDAMQLGAEIGSIFADSMDEAGFQVETFFRKLMALNLDILQRQLLTAIAEIYATQLASKGLLGIIQASALTAVVVGVTETAKAALTKPVKFERGGEFDPFGIEVGGRLHSQGGTKYYGEDGNVIELEKGERLFVNNRKSSALIGALATINQAMGGRGLSGASSYLADGGFASRSISDSVNSQFQSARLAADIVRNLPEFTVSVTELNRVQAGASNVRVVTTL